MQKKGKWSLLQKRDTYINCWHSENDIIFVKEKLIGECNSRTNRYCSILPHSSVVSNSGRVTLLAGRNRAREKRRKFDGEYKKVTLSEMDIFFEKVE